MRIDLTSLLDGRRHELDVEYDYTPDDRGALLPDSITLTAPIHVRAHITDNHGYMTLVASAVAQYKTECDRCLAPLDETISFSIDRLIGTPPTAGKDGDDGVDEEDILPLDGGHVTIDSDLTEALVLELPLFHLCREDCPGLCPKCGKPLAEGDCGCKNKKEIDPRLAILQKLLEKPE